MNFLRPTREYQRLRKKTDELADELGLPRYKPWYGYGLESPRILFARTRNKYRPVFRLKMAWQRATRGYGDDDLWSLDHTLAKLIVVGTRQIRTNGISYPTEFSESPYGNGEEWEAWEKILLQIEEGFQAYIDEHGYFQDKPELEAKFKTAMSLLSFWFSGLWD